MFLLVDSFLVRSLRGYHLDQLMPETHVPDRLLSVALFLCPCEK